MANDCHDDKGLFCEGGGSGGSGTSRPSVGITRAQTGGKDKRGNPATEWRMPDGNPLPKHLEGLKIPPAWTGVQVNQDPEGSLLVTGQDAKGRTQYVYSQKFMDTQKAEKFARVTALDQEFDQIQTANEANRADPAKAEEADCMRVIMQTGIRPGSDRDTKAAKQAFGATTLEGRHVVQTENGVRLQYTGKKGVSLDIPIDDPETASMLVSRAESAGLDGRLFDTDSHTLLAYSHTLGSGSFKTKDFRTLVGTSMAKSEIAKLPKPTSKTAFKKSVSTVAKAVSQKLGNTPSVALKSYIAPEVFAPWQSEDFESSAKAHKSGEPLFDFDIMVGTACSLRHREPGIRVHDDPNPEGDDEDIPCPPDVRMALGFDPDELDGDKSHTCVGEHCFFGNSVNIASNEHVAVLQGLNEWINYRRPSGPQRFYYGVDDFRGSEPEWLTTPVVFAQQHPAHSLVSQDLDMALSTVKAHDGGPGRVAGSIRTPLIVEGDRPALMSEIVFDDPYVQKMHAENRLALSTGFTAGHDESGHLTERVKPNHLLVFVSDEKNQPRDPVTGFLNKEDRDVTDEADKTGPSEEDKTKAKLDQEEQPDEDESETRLKGLISDLLKKLDAVFGSANILSKEAKDPGDPAQKQGGTDAEKSNANDCHGEDGRFCSEGGGSSLDRKIEQVKGRINATNPQAPLRVKVRDSEELKRLQAEQEKGSPWETSLKGAERDRRDELRYKELKAGHGASDKMIALRMAANESRDYAGLPEGENITTWQEKIDAFKAVDRAEDAGQVHPDLASGYRAVIANSPDRDIVKSIHSHIKTMGGMFRHQVDLDNADYPWDECIADQLKKGYSEERAKRICGYIKAKNNMEMMDGRSSTGSDSEEVIMGTEMDALKSKLDAANKAVADQKTELDNTKAQLDAANQQLAAFEKAKKDAAWANMRDTHVPKGWLAGKDDAEKANKESDLRKEFESDAIGFANKILAHAKKLPKDGDKSKEEGSAFGNKDGDGADDHIAAARELRALSGRR